MKEEMTEKGCGRMVRQCAWCLYLIDSEGERISPTGLPKLYEATHGICSMCGIEWMEQVLATDEAAGRWQSGDSENYGVFSEIERQAQKEERRETITQLILQLQRDPKNIPADLSLKPTKRTRSL